MKFTSLKAFLAILGVSLSASVAAAENSAPESEEVAGPKLYVMDCGSLHFDTVGLFGVQDDETEVRDMFVPCYLIQHLGKNFLWDFGLPLAAVGQGDVELLPGASMRYDTSVIEQLADLGLAPADIDLIAPSHLHFDHAGALPAFAGSTLLIQKPERDAMLATETANEYFDPQFFAGMKDTPTIALEGDHDVFGDGRVMIYSAPGHSPGHQVLSIDLDETGPLFLSGDLYHFRYSRVHRRTPVFNFNREQTLASMDRIESLVKEKGATLWIEHDKALANTLRKSPEYYR